MIEVEIPGGAVLAIENVVLDMNGTLAVDGKLLEGVAERVRLLAERVQVTVLTADTHGGARHLEKELGVRTVVLKRGDSPKPAPEDQQKADFVGSLGAKHTAAVGNGTNDARMLQECALGICVVGREGAAAATLAAADVVVCDVRDALDLLLKPIRLVATLRR